MNERKEASDFAQLRVNECMRLEILEVRILHFIRIARMPWDL